MAGGYFFRPYCFLVFGRFGYNRDAELMFTTCLNISKE